jgi:FtsH-binding integral membrane protein
MNPYFNDREIERQYQKNILGSILVTSPFVIAPAFLGATSVIVHKKKRPLDRYISIPTLLIAILIQLFVFPLWTWIIAFAFWAMQEEATQWYYFIFILPAIQLGFGIVGAMWTDYITTTNKQEKKTKLPLSIVSTIIALACWLGLIYDNRKAVYAAFYESVWWRITEWYQRSYGAPQEEPNV